MKAAVTDKHIAGIRRREDGEEHAAVSETAQDAQKEEPAMTETEPIPEEAAKTVKEEEPGCAA